MAERSTFGMPLARQAKYRKQNVLLIALQPYHLCGRQCHNVSLRPF